MIRVCMLLVVIAALVAPAAGSSKVSGDRAAGPTTDILIAFDTTGSMAPSIAAAKEDAKSILSSVSEFTPNARFAVASFRDRFYPGGEYTLLSSFSSSTSKLVAAIARLKAVGTTNAAKDTNAEAYNLLFHETYSDRNIGWHPAARKVVVIIGDAEPHSAGADGIPGCADRTPDWNGLSTMHELGAMRAAKMTLVMIRQARTATASLACYSSLSALAYEGGAARNSGSTNIATPVLSLVKQTFAPFSVTPQLSYGVRGRTDGLTVRVANPNNFPLVLNGLSVKLPRGVALVQGSSTGNLPAPIATAGTLSWKLPATLSPFGVLTGHIILKTMSVAPGAFVAELNTELANGTSFTTNSRASLHVTSTPRRLQVGITGSRGAHSITANVSAALGKYASQGGRGRIMIHLGPGRIVTLRPTITTVRSIGAPTRLTTHLSVTASSGLTTCRAGTAGTLEALDFDAVRSVVRTADTARVILPRSCGGTTVYTDARSGSRASVKLAFH